MIELFSSSKNNNVDEVRIDIPSSINGYRSSDMTIEEVNNKIYLTISVYDIVEDRELIIYEKSKEVGKFTKLVIVGNNTDILEINIKLNSYIHTLHIMKICVHYLTIESYHMHVLILLRSAISVVTIYSVNLKEVFLLSNKEIKLIEMFNSFDTTIYNQHITPPKNIIGTNCKQFDGSEESNIISNNLYIGDKFESFNKLSHIVINYII